MIIINNSGQTALKGMPLSPSAPFPSVRILLNNILNTGINSNLATDSGRSPVDIQHNQRCDLLFSAAPIARAIAYSEPSCCSDGLQTGKTNNDVDDRRTPIGLDYVRRTVRVEVRDS